MTFSVSFLASATVRDIFKKAKQVNWGGTSPDTIDLALFNNTIVPSPDTDPLTYGVSPWNANEVTGTGWSSGGVTLASPTAALVSGVGIKLDANDVSATGTTLSGVHGCLIYDSTLSNTGLIAITFGADFATVAGTFGITFDASGIAVIDLTP